MIEADLTAFLETAVGHSRVHPLVIPQKATLPAVTYQVISDPSELDSSGVVDLRTGRYQITSVAESYLDAKTTANVVRAALNGFAGAMGSTIVGAARKDGHREDREKETGRFTVAQDFIISFKE